MKNPAHQSPGVECVKRILPRQGRERRSPNPIEKRTQGVGYLSERLIYASKKKIYQGREVA